MYGGRINSNPPFPVLLIIITILIVCIAAAPSSAQYLPWGVNQYVSMYPNPQFGFGVSSTLFGVSPFGFGYSSSNNIPVFSPFSRIFINPENYYMPYGFGTTSAFGVFSRPYPIAGFGWRYPWRPW